MSYRYVYNCKTTGLRRASVGLEKRSSLYLGIRGVFRVEVSIWSIRPGVIREGKRSVADPSLKAMEGKGSLESQHPLKWISGPSNVSTFLFFPRKH